MGGLQKCIELVRETAEYFGIAWIEFNTRFDDIYNEVAGKFSFKTTENDSTSKEERDRHAKWDSEFSHGCENETGIRQEAGKEDELNKEKERNDVSVVLEKETSGEQEINVEQDMSFKETTVEAAEGTQQMAYTGDTEAPTFNLLSQDEQLQKSRLEEIRIGEQAIRSEEETVGDGHFSFQVKIVRN